MHNLATDNRYLFFKESLCPELKAKHYHSNDINILRNEFALSNDILKKINNGNAVVGTLDNFEYCIIEYETNRIFHNNSDYQILASVRIPKRNFPEFKMVSRWTGFITDFLICFFTFPFLLILLFNVFFLAILVASTIFHTEEMLEGTKISNLISFILFFIFKVVLFYIPNHFLFKSASRIKTNLFQRKYGSNNSEFINRYVFFNIKDEKQVKRLFNSDVCDKIIDSCIQISEINSKGNCLFFTSKETITNAESFKIYLEYIIDQAKLFVEDKGI